MRYKEIHHLESHDYDRYLSTTFGLSVDGVFWEQNFNNRPNNQIMSSPSVLSLYFKVKLNTKVTFWFLDLNLSQLNHSFFLMSVIIRSLILFCTTICHILTSFFLMIVLNMDQHSGFRDHVTKTTDVRRSDEALLNILGQFSQKSS